MSEGRYDAIIVGAGFSGLYALHRLRGLGLSVRVLEAGGGIGGTWYWNRYPGARCDIESVDYSYSFDEELQQEWTWSERYPAQPELQRYLEHVADRFDLRRDIQLDTLVTDARYDEVAARWLIDTQEGSSFSASYCVMATGMLSVLKRPDFPGVDDFEGEWFHTARWPQDGADLAGKRVGIVGTGSTGIQAATTIAEQAEHLFVFQRTPNYSLPAQNRPLPADEAEAIKSTYGERRRQARESFIGVPSQLADAAAIEATEQERAQAFETRWQQGGLNLMSAYNDLLTNAEANEHAAEFVRSKIRATVKDAGVAERLQPRGYAIGTKRLCVDTGYFEIFNRDNVTLVDVREAPIEAITPRGVRTADTEYELDVIVFATGFDAMTGALLSIDVRGRGGESLRAKWAAGPRTYLGLATAGFPNLFIVTGPGSPSVLSNMVLSIEQHVEWISDCVAHLRANDVTSIEATQEAEDSWVARVAQVAECTLHGAANSWYNGANIPGKPRVYMPYIGGVGEYRKICDGVAARGYDGFLLETTREASEAAA